ncbi:MAG: 4-hydroxybenzoate octaprenyltransferase [Rhodocyclaceae bacterium]|nr:4-hydroxybenzoate octaprenyltransferase [Rhodocyclaceae bacterium]
MNLALVREKLDLYERLMRLDKPIGILLLLWPTLWALWIASEGRPGWLLAWIFILGTVLMRSAGCVINDYADRDFDRHVERTRERPLTSGKVSVGETLLLAATLTVLSALLILPLSKRVWLLACVALFLAVSYPFTKRFFAIPQAYLGIAFGFGIPMAFVAVQDTVPPLGWWMLAANIAWAIAYDTEYAMVDRNDDLKIGIKTSAITFGRFDVAAVMLCYGIAIAILTWIGTQLHYGAFYFSGLAVATGIALYHWTLIRGRERMACFKAFLHNNWLGGAVFAGIVGELNLRPLL